MKQSVLHNRSHLHILHFFRAYFAYCVFLEMLVSHKNLLCKYCISDYILFISVWIYTYKVSKLFDRSILTLHDFSRTSLFCNIESFRI